MQFYTCQLERTTYLVPARHGFQQFSRLVKDGEHIFGVEHFPLPEVLA